MSRADFQALSRRRFIAVSAAAVLAGCVQPVIPARSNRRLLSRPHAPSKQLAVGSHSLNIASDGRDGIIYVPAGYRAETPAPLMLLLHGAGGRATDWFGSYGQRSESNNIVMLAPDSRANSWDIVTGRLDDVAYIDRALDFTFDRCAIDPERIYVAGFSDGASYSLTMGLTNGDLFSRVVAFSPGFLGGIDPQGKPEIFISHGTSDTVIPIDRGGRRIATVLTNNGYSVTYQEFDGKHEVPQAISDAAFTWIEKGRLE